MEIKLIIISLITFLSLQCLAQREVIDLHLTKSKSTVTIQSDSVFYIEKKNQIMIKYEGDGILTYVKVEGGKARRYRKGLYEITFPNQTTDKLSILKVFERTVKGKQQLIYSKVFSLKHIPKPLVTIGGVKNDSALDIKHLIRDGLVRSYHPDTKERLVVHSFTIHFSANDSVRISGGKIPLVVKNKLYYLSEGSLLKLTNIYSFMPDNTLYKTEEIEVFLINSKKYGVNK